MEPKWHIILGAAFTLFIWFIAPNTSLLYLGLLFAASVLIDFDHYAVAVIRTGKLSIVNSLQYYKTCDITHNKERKRGVRKAGDFHLFHTLEFHVLVGILGVFFVPFFYIFLGMVFHSLSDLFFMMHNDLLYRREFFLFKWFWKRF